MNSRLTKTLFAMAALVAVASCVLSCQPKVEEDYPVSLSMVNQTAGPASGSQFLIVSSEGQWNIRLTDAGSWLTLSRTEGSGDANIIMNWTENDTENARACDIEVFSLLGKHRHKLRFTQEGRSPSGPTPSKLVSDKVADWLEIPAVSDNDGRYFFTHDMTIAGKTTRNYSFYLDPSALVSVWVAYPLNKGLISSGSRTNEWGLDPKVPRANQAVVFSGFKGGYQRGHQLPSADRYERKANIATFYGTNMTPQLGSLNEAGWATLEGMVRDWSYKFDTLYVVTGADIVGAKGQSLDNDGKSVTVPVGYFKALLGYKKNGTLGITASTGGYTAVGFYVNHQAFPENEVMSHVMTIDDLEKKTGFDFFPNLEKKITAEKAEYVESTMDPWWK